MIAKIILYYQSDDEFKSKLIHDSNEITQFVENNNMDVDINLLKRLDEKVNGKMSEEMYAKFLWNQHAIYNLLEACAMANSLFNDFPTVRRAPKILADFQELWKESENPTLTESTEKYVRHIFNIKDDPEKLMAHIYVRHMGDLSGGQMIKKRAPGKGTMYEFDCDIKETKEIIRSKTSDSMADEAKLCFEYATELFKELYAEKKETDQQVGSDQN